MARTLRRTITVDGTVYPAGTTPPGAVAKKITNPRAWDDSADVVEETPPDVPLAADAAAEDVVSNNADVVIAYALANPSRAKELLSAETAAEVGKDRQGVKDALTKLLEA